jgi:mRNA interferase MazF
MQASFEERYVWCCSLGLNVGDAEYGKGVNLRRPVLVLKKFNKRIFWGIPFATQVKDKPYYHKIKFKCTDQCIMITQ